MQNDAEKIERIKMAFESALYGYQDRELDDRYDMKFDVSSFLAIFEVIGLAPEPEDKPISDTEQFVLGAIETGASKVIDETIDKWLAGEFNMDRDYTIQRISELRACKRVLHEMIDRLRIFYGGTRLYGNDSPNNINDGQVK